MLKEPTILARLIQSYARTANLAGGKQLHALLLTAGAATSTFTFLSNHLLTFYSKCRDLESALHLFDQMPQPNPVSWTALISAYFQNSRPSLALRTFFSMHSSGIKPTQFSLSSSIQSVAALRVLESGQQLHGLSFKLGFDVELFVGSNLADMYSKCGCLVDACRVFEEMPHKDEVSWTAMIDGYAKNGELEQAVVAFKKLMAQGTIPVDELVLSSVVNACGGLKASRQGKSLHSLVLKLGFDCEEVGRNALADMYSKVGDMESASELMGWNVVCCSSLIDGYVENDQMDKALSTFVEANRRGVKPNEFTFSSLIKACAGQAVPEQGTQLHAQVVKTSIALDPFVSAVLVDMYGKCGLLHSALQMFVEITNPDDFAWNSIIGVLAQHGRGRGAIQFFNQMISKGIKPNHVTFVNLLMACSHSGLVERGLDYFSSMNKIHGVEPSQEHYACVIDLLGRAGRLKDAEEFIDKMPFEPNAFAWCSLLGACRTYRAKQLGEIAAEKLIKLEPGNSGLHILLSSIYASFREWEDVKAMRKLMRDSGVKKLPGLSWVDVANKTHCFGAEDWSHPDKGDIYDKLEAISTRIRDEGYVPFTGGIASNVEEGAKERLLQNHSERIAVAFALLRVPEGKLIIVKKNLRVCVDCHSVIKLISKVEGREIVVRDNARFHHFAGGLCSCGDYW